MRTRTLFIALCLSVSLLADEIPVGYYDAIQGTQDSVLKSTLSLIVRGGTRYEYGINQYHSTNNPPEWVAGDLKAYGTWQALPFTDRKAGGVVWDMYSNCVRYYPNKLGDSGCSLNIEHCLPKSWWGGTVNEAYKDLYNLNPSDQRANSQKSNYPPGHVKNADKFDNGSFRIAKANTSGYGYICWEPAPEYRGDFARTYFYMATAYEYLKWTAYPQFISNSTYLMFSDSIQQVLLDWHRADPVSEKELCRADQISSIQGNRNPYIDYPELVEYIWGDQKGQAVDLNTLTCAFATGFCPDDMGEPEPQIYDTLINLPAITAALVNAIPGGSANSGIQSNGNASITMGKSSTDGEISFSGLQLTDSAILAFRASPYNSATSMQLEIYLNETLDTTILVNVQQETRHEVRYRIPVPAETTSIRILSVGGGTSKRACMQELYLLTPKQNTTALTLPPTQLSDVSKELHNGRIIIRRNQAVYTPLGQQIR
ncbi:MAG: endonuclease [Paludibacteraceae bacterium]|nr:endonuclease [Paludibacteraceae bacterium]